MARIGVMVIAAVFVIPASLCQGDALLFPYIVSSPSVATIVSVVNKDVHGELFLDYYYKRNLAHNSECDSLARREVGSGENDLVSFEVNGKFVGPTPASTLGGPLFNDPNGAARYAGDDFTMRRGDSATRAVARREGALAGPPPPRRASRPGPPSPALQE